MKEKKKVIIELSDEILADFELNRIPFQQILMKCSRLSRLVGDMKFNVLIEMELSGYEYDHEGILTPESWICGELVGRTYHEKDKKGQVKYYMRAVSVSKMESYINNYETNILAAKDVSVSISSNSNINPYIPNNAHERLTIKNTYDIYISLLSTIKGKIYNYVADINYKYKFEEKIITIFEKRQNITNDKLKDICPDFSKQLISVYDNIESTNEEDWANAIHTCRRILKSVADSLYPAIENQPKDGKIKLGKENYINRLIAYIEENVKSKSSKKMIGNSLEYIGKYIDSVYNTSNKGTHDKVTKEEAERCIIYTYILLGDILKIN